MKNWELEHDLADNGHLDNGNPYLPKSILYNNRRELASKRWR